MASADRRTRVRALTAVALVSVAAVVGSDLAAAMQRLTALAGLPASHLRANIERVVGDIGGAVGPAVLRAQSPTFGVGRAARPEEIASMDITVTPDGHGLPAGSGTAAAGQPIYAARCVTCHGATGKEGPQDVLVGGRGTLAAPKPLKTVGSYWPYSTIVFDYVRRAMPFDHPGSLPADQVYSVTAYVLYLNGIIGEHDVMDQTTLPKVKMPNRDGFVGDPRPDTGAKKR